MPNKTQANLIERTIGCARFVYNCMLADKIKQYKDTKLSLKNTPAQYKNEFEFLKEVDFTYGGKSYDMEKNINEVIQSVSRARRTGR